MCLFGWNDSAMFFVLPFLFYVITRLMIACWGESYLPVLSVLYAVIEMTSVFESTGEAMRPILPIYIGDKNVPAVLGLTKHSRTVNLILGFAFGGVLAVGAPWIPLAFDITDPALVQICIGGMRIFAIACPMLALMSLMNSYYLNTDKPGLAMLETILVQFLCPLVLAGLFIYFTSPEGLFVGYAASPYLAAVILFAYIRIRYGREGFPYYIEDNTLALLDEGVELDRDGIRAFTDKAGRFLRDHKVDEHIVSAVELTSDTVLLFIKEKNPDDLVSAECCLRIEPGRVYFSIWDSGEIFDITDAASGTDSFRSKVMARIIKERLIEKKHMTATSFNRNALVGDVRDDQHEMVFIIKEEIIEVAADLPGRDHIGRERKLGPVRDVRGKGGQGPLLDRSGHVQFCAGPLFFGGHGLQIVHIRQDACLHLLNILIQVQDLVIGAVIHPDHGLSAVTVVSFRKTHGFGSQFPERARDEAPHEERGCCDRSDREKEDIQEGLPQELDSLGCDFGHAEIDACEGDRLTRVGGIRSCDERFIDTAEPPLIRRIDRGRGSFIVLRIREKLIRVVNQSKGQKPFTCIYDNIGVVADIALDVDGLQVIHLLRYFKRSHQFTVGLIQGSRDHLFMEICGGVIPGLPVLIGL